MLSELFSKKNLNKDGGNFETNKNFNGYDRFIS